ncbi:hypothetical protein OAR19_00570 [bacterium]|nr:hypothetical protein [bacterium]
MKRLLIILLILFAGINAAGTVAGSDIFVPSTNIELAYSDGGGSATSKNGSEDGLADISTTILEINGLVETDVDSTEINYLLSGGVYRNVTPGVDVVLRLTYLNRGNTDEETRISVDITQAASRWTGDVMITVNIVQDQTHQFVVTINPATVENLERATVDILADLVSATNVVSYNAYSGAVGLFDGGFQSDVSYGGTDNIGHQYVLEAEGYDLEFVKRASLVTAPGTYGGTITDVVPGSIIRYKIVVKNNSGAVAKDVEINDQIPNNCHMYNTDTPTPNADFISPANDTSGEGTAVLFRVTVPANSTATVNYSVTID